MRREGGKKHFRLSGLVLVTAVSLLAACNFADWTDGGARRTATTPLAALSLHPVANCDEYRDRLADGLFHSFTEGYVYGYGYLEGDTLPAASADTAAPGGAAGAGGAQQKSTPDAVSQTNTQEAGVDEADLVKTDAQGILYVVRNRYLLVEKGFPPAELAELARLDLAINVSRLYLDEANRRLVIFGDDPVFLSVAVDKVSSSPIAPDYYNRTHIVFVDIHDPAAPKVSSRLLLDGYQVDSRMVAQRVHLVTRFNTPVPAALTADTEFAQLLAQYWQTRWGDGKTPVDSVQLADLEQQLREHIKAALRATAVEDLLPRLTRINAAGESSGTQLLACGDISRPEVGERAGLQIVSSFDSDGDKLQATAITGDAWEVYASPQNLYLAQNSGYWWWGGGEQQQPQTVVHKFAISGNAPQYRATGAVAGWINDQFNLSEYAGRLRLATSRFMTGILAANGDNGNDLYILEDDGAGRLATRGSVQGFAANERIYSVRFVEDSAYVVTFRQVDPLFTFDLSDADQPRLVGSVEIPGFSTYMHPLDKTHLLTIGRGGDSTGATNQLQLQIFDVSDLAAPKRTFSYVPVSGSAGYSWSEAAYNHLAFTYFAPRGLLAIPLQSYNAANEFNGFALLHVDTTTGFTDLGRVDHRDLARQAVCADSAANLSPDSYQYYCGDARGFIYAAYPLRSVFMTEGEQTYLYTLSTVGIKATDTNAPSVALGKLTFPWP